MSKSKSDKTDKTEEFELEEDPSQLTQVIRPQAKPKSSAASSRPTSVRVERAPPPKERRPMYREYESVNTISDLGKAMSKSNLNHSFKAILAVLCLSFALYKGKDFLGDRNIFSFIKQDPAAQNSRLAEVQIETDVVGFEVFWNGKPVTLFNNRFEALSGQEGELLIKRFGYEDFIVRALPKEGKLTMVRPVFSQEKRTGFLTFETVPSAKLILMQNGRVVLETETPISGQKVPVGKYKVLVENDFIGYRSEEEVLIEEWKTTSIRRQIGHK